MAMPHGYSHNKSFKFILFLLVCAPLITWFQDAICLRVVSAVFGLFTEKYKIKNLWLSDSVVLLSAFSVRVAWLEVTVQIVEEVPNFQICYLQKNITMKKMVTLARQV
ncbi:hypothetical protein BY996DRAFT_8689069 [Phakopsora pachyrhizi]|nr:hypothetical protein BY996DRAFT_8689069 [Phakopsora pachyrhizi]